MFDFETKKQITKTNKIWSDYHYSIFIKRNMRKYLTLCLQKQKRAYNRDMKRDKWRWV